MVADLRTPCFGYVGIGMNAFGIPDMYSYSLPIDTYGLSVTVFELFSWLQKRFCPFARPTDPDMMTNTALKLPLRRAAVKQQKLLLNTLQFLNPSRSHSSRIKEQRSALSTAQHLDSYNRRQLILQT